MAKKEKEPTEEEIIEEMEDMTEDQQLDQFENSQDFNEEYDAPTPTEQFNTHSFLHKATFGPEVESLKTTYLDKEELGRPIFTVRSLLDMEILARYYLDDFAKEYQVKNKIQTYFRNKILNITDSGMSNEGFVMNLNVTSKKNIERKRVKNPIENLHGGENKNKN
jgi:hypothetical protein